MNAQFRIATEKTLFAMPETKIGYCPDVGASYFLSRVDGEIGTYLALTGDAISGRAVLYVTTLAYPAHWKADMHCYSEHGFATHYVPSRRIPALLERLAALESPTYTMINDLLEQERFDAEDSTGAATSIVGVKREAVDEAFKYNTVEKIIESLTGMSQSHKDEAIRQWAASTLETLALRSPTSLKVALTAIRRGKQMTLLEALQMEMNIATAFCVSYRFFPKFYPSVTHESPFLQSGGSPDFHTGVTTLLVKKIKERPAWSPSRLEEVEDSKILETFFSKFSPEHKTAPELTPPPYLPKPTELGDPMRYALPTEAEIQAMVDGSHRNSGATSITLDELLAKFARLRGNKAGVREKILEVAQRKCEQEADKHTDKMWLKWKP